MPLFILWGLRNNKNKEIFENRQPLILKAVSSILGAFKERRINKDAINPCLFKSSLVQFLIQLEFFYGVKQGHDNIFGASMVLHITHSKFYHIKLGVGEGTNTKPELLVLWRLLYFASFKEVSNLQILGVSKLTFDWINCKCNLKVLYLELWQLKIQDLQEGFQELKISHIYREFNYIADDLSKKPLSLRASVLSIKYFMDYPLFSKEDFLLFKFIYVLWEFVGVAFLWLIFSGGL